MKKICAIMLGLLMLAGVAQAYTVAMENTRVEYNKPEEYAAVSGKMRQDIGSMLEYMLPGEVIIHEIFMQEDRSNPLFNKFLVVASFTSLEGEDMNQQDFDEMKAELIKDQGGFVADEAMKDELNESLNELSAGAMEIGGVEFLGFFEDTDSAISFGALARHNIDLGNGPMIMRQVMFCSFILVDGKMLFIGDYSQVHADSEAKPACEASLRRIKAMNFTVQ